MEIILIPIAIIFLAIAIIFLASAIEIIQAELDKLWYQGWFCDCDKPHGIGEDYCKQCGKRHKLGTMVSYRKVIDDDGFHYEKRKD